VLALGFPQGDKRLQLSTCEVTFLKDLIIKELKKITQASSLDFSMDADTENSSSKSQSQVSLLAPRRLFFLVLHVHLFVHILLFSVSSMDIPLCK
jgi:hypothetical protein